MNLFTAFIAETLSLPARSVEATLKLLSDGATVPFISRYRKEATGNLDEVQITQISEQNERLTELSKRKETVLKTITELGKLTEALQQRIESCWNATELEDIYLPYKPKRRTRAQVARENGLTPLATILLLQRENAPLQAAQRFVSAGIKTAAEALKGAQDIIAEQLSEDESTRQFLRKGFEREAMLVVKVKKDKATEEQAAKYRDYFDHSEPLKRCSAHRFLAIKRGESEGFLSVNITVNDDFYIARMQQKHVKSGNESGKLVAQAIEDAYKRLLFPALKNEVLAARKEFSDDEAIAVFAQNLRQLLLAAPLGQKRVLGIDPGFRTGCKLVCLDAEGNLLHHEVIYPHAPHHKEAEAQKRLQALAKQYGSEAIAIGNGTASRETAAVVKRTDFGAPMPVFTVSEDGASIYSASAIARQEFPDEDVTVRGAVSIARRLMDPLAELVKIEPKSIGVGQYQHDVDQTKLKRSLDSVVQLCVNSVGVNLNTASRHLLTYVSGLSGTLAQNIVEYRRQNGAFGSRQELKKVPRLGAVAFQQCAGFLRIPHAKHPLDNTAVHPESYAVVEKMAKENGCSIAELIQDKSKQRAIDLQRYLTDKVGLPTLQDIMRELDKPGRDPREELETFEFDERVQTVADLVQGMELPGNITNITNFGVFVDVGVHQDGLVHISQLSNRYVSDPTQVVKLHQHVRVKVLEVDRQRNRISLTMRLD